MTERTLRIEMPPESQRIGFGTKVWIDDMELHCVRSFSVNVSAGDAHEVVLTLIPDRLVITQREDPPQS